MTIFGPDVSGYQAGLKIQAGTPFMFAKATEGTGYTDSSYANFKAQAASVGALFAGYHFLTQGNGAAQAQHAISVIGKTTCTMLDVETDGSSNAGVADIEAFVAEYRALGGNVKLVYIPHWYWGNIGSPSLAPLNSLGLSLISSDYTSYSDGGPGWAAYGGVNPQLWQFTDAYSYGGSSIDYNAYRGTVAQLSALMGYIGAAAPSSPAAPVASQVIANPAQHNPYTPLSVDGAFGANTAKALDLIIYAGHVALAQNGSWQTDDMKCLQQHLGVSADGVIGPQTVKALQAKLGVSQDGVWGAQTTTALQTALNNGTFS
jgi:GH25 family lysozyme M1 (1,4-beta-N-acetylmuramidase)